MQCEPDSFVLGAVSRGLDLVHGPALLVVLLLQVLKIVVHPELGGNGLEERIDFVFQLHFDVILALVLRVGFANVKRDAFLEELFALLVLKAQIYKSVLIVAFQVPHIEIVQEPLVFLVTEDLLLNLSIQSLDLAILALLEVALDLNKTEQVLLAMSPTLKLVFVRDVVFDHLLRHDLPSLAPDRKVLHELVVEALLPEVGSVSFATASMLRFLAVLVPHVLILGVALGLWLPGLLFGSGLLPLFALELLLRLRHVFRVVHILVRPFPVHKLRFGALAAFLCGVLGDQFSRDSDRRDQLSVGLLSDLIRARLGVVLHFDR